jgi:hypothetical protein
MNLRTLPRYQWIVSSITCDGQRTSTLGAIARYGPSGNGAFRTGLAPDTNSIEVGPGRHSISSRRFGVTQAES